MTMTADGTTTRLGPGDARDTLLEMAAVTRTLFGVGLTASHRAGETVAVEADPPRERTPAATTYAAPASIPMPGLPAPAAQREVPPAPEAPTPYAGEVPALRVVPEPPTPVDDVQPERRQAVLREVAFLDD